MPNLFIPGSAKSGTSSLHEYLNQHPDISMSSEKEPHFFCVKRNKNEAFEYEKLFENGKKYRGESSTGYMVFHGVPERIKKINANPKFIFLLRNPVDRILSHYNWLHGQAAETKAFVDAVKYDMDIEPVFGKKGPGPGYKSYFQWGLYGKWIEKYIYHFGAENILVIFSEELKSRPASVLKKCTDFLELDDFEFNLSAKENISVNVKGKKIFYFLQNYRPDNDSFFLKAYRKNPYFLRKYISKVRILISNKYKSKFSDNELYKLSFDERKWLTDLYANDVTKLKKIINNEIELWEDFNTTL